MTFRARPISLSLLLLAACPTTSAHSGTVGGNMPRTLLRPQCHVARALHASSADVPPYQELTPLEFARGEHRLNPYHRAILDDVAIRLNGDRDLLLQLTRTAPINEPEGVAIKRAESAHYYLVRRKGVAPSRIFFSVVCSGTWQTSEERRRIVLNTIPKTWPLHLWPYSPGVWNCEAAAELAVAPERAHLRSNVASRAVVRAR